jgi:murein DD-endopeptidase MepM/ murein hydrolase activator NlpD
MLVRRILGRFLVVVALIQALHYNMNSHQKSIAFASGEVFLSSPYYGNEVVTAWFDHRLPGHGGDYGDGFLLKYTGEERLSPWPGEDWCDWLAHDNCYDGHNGTDFGLNYERVLAAATGTVIEAMWDDEVHRTVDYGLTVLIEHQVNGIYFRTRYGHLSSIAVMVGDTVFSGQVIGTSGNTGRTDGPHLHFGVYGFINESWRVIDPFGWKPVPGADETVDPWSLSADGAASWCMWARGEWVRHCSDNPEYYPVTTIPDPALTLSLSENEVIVEDSLINNNTFSKGYGGLWLNPCNNLDPACRDWDESTTTNGGHTLLTIADGVDTSDNWAKWKPGLPSNFSDIYEIFVYVPDIAGYTDDTFTWQAKYKVVDGNGTTHEAIVDQYTGDKWLSIGSYYLVGTSNTSYVYLTDATGEEGNIHCPNGPVENNQHWCRLTVDAVKFVKLGVRYTLDISPTIPGRFSEVVLSNPALGVAQYKVSFFSGAGAYYGGVWNPSVPSQGQVVVSTECPAASYAVVTANRDLAVVVEYADVYGPSYSHNGIAAMDPSNPGWGEIGEPMNLPIIMQNYWT